MNNQHQHQHQHQQQTKLAYSVNETAAALGLSASSIWKWISLGQLRAIRVGGRTLITAEELDRVLETGI
jgi:excisionase family DNA binding protein